MTVGPSDPSDPIERKEPDLDPGLAPDPEHEVEESPPEGVSPMRNGEDDDLD